VSVSSPILVDVNDDDRVFKALADPTRRFLLDRLKPGAQVSLSQKELNAWVEAELPKAAPEGVRNTKLELGAGSAVGTALVDFIYFRFPAHRLALLTTAGLCHHVWRDNRRRRALALGRAAQPAWYRIFGRALLSIRLLTILREAG
jgi:hypothetical protein